MHLKNEPNRNRIKNIVSLICLILSLLWFCNENTRQLIPFPVICVIYMIWIILSIQKNPKFIKVIILNSSLLMLWVFFIAIRTIIGSSGLSHELIYAVTLLMIYYIFLFYMNEGIRYKIIIFKTVIFGYLITAIYSAYYLNMNPELVRMAAAGLLTDEKYNYLSQYGPGVLNIGGFDYIYSLVGIVIICWYIFQKSKRKMVRIFYLICGFLFVFIILNASFSTAIIMLLMCIFLMLFPKIAYLKVIYICTSIAIMAVIIPFIDDIINLLSTSIGNEAFVYKLNATSKLLNGGNIADFYPRISLLAGSFNTFLHYPIAGVYGLYDHVNNNIFVSGHVQWIDDLARYGLFSSILFYLGVFQIVKILLVYANDRVHKKLTKTVLVYVFMFGFMNPVLLINIYILIFIILPFSSSIVLTKDNEGFVKTGVLNAS